MLLIHCYRSRVWHDGVYVAECLRRGREPGRGPHGHQGQAVVGRTDLDEAMEGRELPQTNGGDAQGSETTR